MKAIWSGGISFGLIYIPINLYSATKNVTLDLDMLSKKDLAPIKYERIDSKTGEEVAWRDIVKGFKYSKGDYVVLNESDFEKVDVKKSKAIEISCFVDSEEIDPIYFDKPYYLEPAKGADRTYALLVKALKETNKVAVSQFVLRSREHLCIIKPEGNMLVLNQMRYESEVRSPSSLTIPKGSELKEKELKVAKDIIKEMTENFKASDYKDSYTDGLKKIIDAKAHNKKIKVKYPKLKKTETKDLMAQLEKSLKTIKVKETVKR